MDDFEAIRQLTARYNRASDEADIDAWLDCFAEDGSFTRSNADRSYRGKQELRELLTTFPIKGRHITTDYVVEIDGDSAHQSCYLVFFDRERNFQVNMFGTYDDRLVRHDGRWYFLSRVLNVDTGGEK
jgi:3-phenylpropionate/cinnamic acid dioxygenase small subunit